MGQLLFFGLLQRLSRTCRVNESPPWADARQKTDLSGVLRFPVFKQSTD